jgi:hypothetical protein
MDLFLSARNSTPARPMPSESGRLQSLAIPLAKNPVIRFALRLAPLQSWLP